MPIDTRSRSSNAAVNAVVPPMGRRLFSKASRPQEQPEREEGEAKSSALRILVVEDETLVALATQSALRRAGYDPVAIAGNGEEAVRLALRYHPDIILMDIRLREPQTDGIQAVAEIRERMDCAIVYVTAYSDLRTTARAAETAPHGYLNKPYSDRQLVDAIDAAIRKKRQGRQDD